MYNSSSHNKLSEQFTITQNKLGSGAFGSVYLAKLNNKDIAVKCETKTAQTLTLLREFKICRKIYLVKKYIKYKNYLNNFILNEKNTLEEKNKLDEILKNMEMNPIIKIFNYLSDNDMLLVPQELNINFLLKTKCIPETFSYLECNDFNFLTMELCGDNFENLLEKYKFSERAKYFIAHRLLHVMSCIHRCGLIHRDIKLSNFVLDKQISENKEYNK